MFDKLMDTIAANRVAKEERKKIELERQMKLENQKFQIDLERLKLESKLLSEGKLPPENLDRMSMEQMEKSWKDEFIMAILFSPVILAFFPTAQTTVEQGFKILSTDMPEWYMYLLSGIVVVTFGLRSLVKLVLTGKSKMPKLSSANHPNRRAVDKTEKTDTPQ
jgi:hypothetical protein